MIVFKSLFSLESSFSHPLICLITFRVRNQADTRRQRLQEASTVHQFIRDLEDEEAQLRYIFIYFYRIS
jgi:hypothetical protein